LVNLPAATQTAIIDAVCSQVETLYLQGGVNALNGNGDNQGGSVSIGKFSMNAGTSNLQSINGIPISPMVRVYLWQTGLLYRGVPICESQSREEYCAIP